MVEQLGGNSYLYLNVGGSLPLTVEQKGHTSYDRRAGCDRRRRPDDDDVVRQRRIAGLNDWQKSYRDLFDRPVLELLRLQAQFGHVLIDRGVTRSSYNPVADRSEIPFLHRFWMAAER